MIRYSYASAYRQINGANAAPPKVLVMLQTNPPDSTGKLDGSAEELFRFLQELIEITGQNQTECGIPILELRFGDILTVTTLTKTEEIPCLSITALLPKVEAADYMGSMVAPSCLTGNWECMRHADTGSYVILRKMPVASLLSERCVMDAIADTADMAALWLAKLVSNIGEKHQG